VARTDANGSNTEWYGTDKLGSVRFVADNSGTASNKVTYNAWGNILTGTPVDRYANTGREWDDLLDLQHNRARMYDPSTGRWLSEDPIGFAAGDANLRRNSGNNLNSNTDPSGLDFITIPPQQTTPTLPNIKIDGFNGSPSAIAPSPGVMVPVNPPSSMPITLSPSQIQPITAPPNAKYTLSVCIDVLHIQNTYPCDPIGYVSILACENVCNGVINDTPSLRALEAAYFLRLLVAPPSYNYESMTPDQKYDLAIIQAMRGVPSEVRDILINQTNLLIASTVLGVYGLGYYFGYSYAIIVLLVSSTLVLTFRNVPELLALLREGEQEARNAKTYDEHQAAVRKLRTAYALAVSVTIGLIPAAGISRHIYRRLTAPKNIPGTRADLHIDLRSKGFEYRSTSQGGYVTYKHPDGRAVTIKPNGEVIPTKPAVSTEGKRYNERTDYDFNRLPNQSHTTGHNVGPLPK
jgi:RHS repeat-associated protein